METIIKNQDGQHIIGTTCRDEILDMIDKGEDTRVVQGFTVDIIRSFRKNGLHEVDVLVHGLELLRAERTDLGSPQ